MNEYFKKVSSRYFYSFQYFYKRLRHRVFIRMGLDISVGVMDGLGLAMFLPLLQMAGEDSSVDPNGLGHLGFLINGLESIGVSLNLVSVLSLMSFFFVLKGLAQYSNSIYDVYLRQRFTRTLRINLSDLLSNMSYKAFVLSDAGRIQNTLSGEVMRMSKAYQSYFGGFQQIIMVIVYISFAFFIDANFALLICIGGGLTNFIYKKLYEATKSSSRKLTKDTNHYQGLILQFVTNFKYLKATRFIMDYNKKLKDSIKNIEENNRKIGQLNSVVISIREPILILVVSAVILVQVSVLGGELGTILISLLFFYRALAALILLQTFYNEYLSVSGSMHNMTSFEEELQAQQEKEEGKVNKEFSEVLELKNAGFEYSGRNILKKINLKIRKNETTAFVGGSGSGKTTLINIITGLMPLSEGLMLVDGVNINTINIGTFGRRIGYITQEPVIFNDTLFNNISFWAEPTEENYSRYKRATRQAYIQDFIDKLPEKENTLLGNNGINLSGGQKQRISIARELYKNVDILVLDEATSALDSETEEAIQKGIEELQGSYTILIVAHRLSTIKNADRILVMNNGMIQNEGNFGELLLNSSQFQKMVELQEV